MTRSLSPIPAATLVILTAISSRQQATAQVRQGPEHRILASEAGVWDAESKFWMTPEADPLTSKAVETNSMLGEFWMVSQYKSDLGGFPFEGRGQFGYDPVSKKFTGTWVDTMSPYLSVMEGSMDQSSKTLTMLSKGRDAQTGKESLSKMVTTYVDEDHKKFEMFGPVEGKEGQWWKMMEINYTRRK